MQKIKHDFKNLIILFGGARREKTIIKLKKNKFKIKKIIYPASQSAELKKSINKLKIYKFKSVTTKKKNLHKILDKFPDSLVFSIGFPYIIPVESFAHNTLALNLHPTLLPKYRGPTTGAYILKNNEKKTGSTIHLISKKIDSGDILSKSFVKINPFDTIKSMQRKVYNAEAKLVISTLKKLKKGIKPLKQNNKFASTFKKVRKPEDSRINAHKPLIDLINDIRACDTKKFPAFFKYKNQKVCIKLWRSNKYKKEHDEL